MKINTIFLAVIIVAVCSGCSTSGVMYEKPIPQTGIIGATDMYNKAQEYYEAEKYEMAKEFFHQYINNYANTELYRVSLYYLGHCHQMLGQDQEAVRLYNKIIQEYPSTDFWVERAQKRLAQLRAEMSAK